MLRPIYERTKPSRPCVRRVRYSGLWGGSYCRATTLGIGVAPCPTPLRIPGYGHQGCSGRLLVRLSQYGAAVRHSVNWQAAAQVALTKDGTEHALRTAAQDAGSQVGLVATLGWWQQGRGRTTTPWCYQNFAWCSGADSTQSKGVGVSEIKA